MSNKTEKRWSAIVLVRGHGEIEYQFDSRDMRDAMSYLEDNVMEDYGVKILMSNIIKLEEID